MKKKMIMVYQSKFFDCNNKKKSKNVAMENIAILYRNQLTEIFKSSIDLFEYRLVITH